MTDPLVAALNAQRAEFDRELLAMAGRLQRCSEALTRAAERRDREPERAALRGLVVAWELWWDQGGDASFDDLKSAVAEARRVLEEG